MDITYLSLQLLLFHGISKGLLLEEHVMLSAKCQVGFILFLQYQLNN